MFFTFPEDVHWDEDRQAVALGIEIGEYRGVAWVPRRVLQRLLTERPTPQRCLEAYYLQRTRFERIAERKLRHRQLTDDGNVEIIGRDLRRAPGSCRRAGGPSPGAGWGKSVACGIAPRSYRPIYPKGLVYEVAGKAPKLNLVGAIGSLYLGFLALRRNEIQLNDGLRAHTVTII